MAPQDRASSPARCKLACMTGGSAAAIIQNSVNLLAADGSVPFLAGRAKLHPGGTSAVGARPL